MKTKINIVISTIIIFALLLMNVPVIMAAPTELSTDGTATRIEAEDIGMTGTKMTSVNAELGGTYSGTGYMFEMNTVSGAATKTVTIPVTVSKSGTYAIAVHGSAYATKSSVESDTGHFSIKSGEDTVDLSRDTTVLFGALRNGTTYTAYSYTGQIHLTGDLSPVELIYTFTGTDKYKLVLDCIDFSCIQLDVEEGKEEEDEDSQIPVIEIASDGSTARGEFETFAVDGMITKTDIDTSFEGTFSGTGYAYQQNSVSGAATKTVTIPVTVTKAGTYTIDVHGSAYATKIDPANDNGHLSIKVGETEVPLTRNTTVLFGAKPSTTTYKVYSYVGEIELATDTTSVDLIYTFGGSDKFKLVLDCIDFAFADNAGGDNTGGDNTGGDNTGGDNTGGDNTGGDNTGGDNTGGDNTGGDNTGGDNTGGDNTGDDNTGEDNTDNENSIAIDGSATRFEAENIGVVGTLMSSINSASGGTYSGTGYIFEMNSVSGPATKVVRFPVNVKKNGIYSIDVIGCAYSVGAVPQNDKGTLTLSAGDQSAPLSRGETIIFGALRNGATYNTYSYTGEICLSTDITEIVLTYNFTGADKYKFVFDCIDFAFAYEGVSVDGSATRIEAEELGVGNILTLVENGECSGGAYIADVAKNNPIEVPVTIVKEGFYEISFAGNIPEGTHVTVNDFYKQEILSSNESLFSTTIDGEIVNTYLNNSILYLNKDTSSIQLIIPQVRYILDYIDLKYIENPEDALVLKEISFEKYTGEIEKEIISSATSKIYLSFNDVLSTEMLHDNLKLVSKKDGKSVDMSISYTDGVCEITLNKMLMPNTYYELWIDDELCCSDEFTHSCTIYKVFRTEDDGMFVIKDISVKRNGDELNLAELNNNDSLTLNLEFIKTTDEQAKYTLFYFAYEEDTTTGSIAPNTVKYIPVNVSSDSRGKLIYSIEVTAADVDNITKIQGSLWSYPDNVSVARCEY